MFRRLVVISFGFVVAAAAGMVFLPLALFVDASNPDGGLAVALTNLFAAALGVLDEGSADDAFAAVGFVLWAVGVVVCAAPLAIAALIGEVAGVRAYTWYAGASALFAAASPWIARAARGLPRAGEMSVAEGRLALLFFLTGALTGSLYWLIAVRGAAPAAGDGER